MRKDSHPSKRSRLILRVTGRGQPMKAMVVSPVGGRVPTTTARDVLHPARRMHNDDGDDEQGLPRGGGGMMLCHGNSRRDLEAEEVAAYLSKLRSLVPDMPRKRKLSKLELIQRVIEYICELQSTLEQTNQLQAVDPGAATRRQPLQPLFNATAAIHQQLQSTSAAGNPATTEPR